MRFAIQKQNNSFSFFATHNKVLLIAGIVGSRKEALNIIFNQIKEVLGKA